MSTVGDPAEKEIRREQESEKEDIYRRSFIHKYMKQLGFLFQELGQEREDTDSSHDK